MSKFIKHPNFLAILITSILFIIPFFWFKPGEMDLGGDENRLFFYDPLHFIYNNSLFLKEIVTLGNRSYEPFFHQIPFVSILLLSKSVVNSPYFLICILNGIKLSVSFLSVYLIIKIILQNSYKEKREFFIQIPSVLGGFLYTTAPIIIGNYEKALLSHNQIFLNPLCLYLIFKYFITGRFRYLLGFIAVTLVFTTSFSWPSAPPIFAFFPLALLFLFLYVFYILKKKINYTHILIAVLLFLCLHAFHILPEIYNLLRPGSYINERVFSINNINEYLNYYYGVLPLSKLSLNILLYAPLKQYILLSIIPAVLIFLGLCFKTQKSKTVFLTGIFFLITLYLVTVNITGVGVKLYEYFFYIPGFSMFRNFIGQWAFVYTFFYALLFGQAIYFLFRKINNIKASIIIAAFTGLSIIATSWNFFTGSMVNTVLFQTNDVRIPIVMDPNYKKTLDFIRTFKDDGVYISFPFTDSYETVIHGLNNGAYEGPSPINWLVGRLDYNGYIGINPFGEIFFKLAKDKNYDAINRLLGLLNVRYIYYNDDPKVYDKTFPGNPYNSARAVMPKTQQEYKSFIKKIAGKEIYHTSTYHIYETKREYYHPEFYAAGEVKFYKTPKTELFTQKEAFFDESPVSNDVFIDVTSCEKLFLKSTCAKRSAEIKSNIKIKYNKVNPTLYQVHITDAKRPYMLVFSHSFSNSWIISQTKNNVFHDLWYPKVIPAKHTLANGYANAWYITPTDVDNRSDYTLTVQLADQRIFYIGAIISIITLVSVLIFWIFYLSRR